MRDPRAVSETHDRANSRLFIFDLTSIERAALTATFCGWMLDGLDVMIYSFVVPTLIASWHLTTAQAGTLATTTLIVSALGGWVGGILADRYGRTLVLQGTILWFAVFTFLCGFTQNYGQLMIARALQGLGFGGEWAVGAALISETIRPYLRGRAVGLVQAGWSFGWAIAAGAYALLFTLIPENDAWRILFWIGLAPALFVFYIRGKVTEPPIPRRYTSDSRLVTAIFGLPILRITVLTSLLATGAQGGYYAVTTWLPLYLKQERHLTLLSSSGHLFVIIAGSFAGYLTGAFLTDRLGRRPTLLLFAAGSLITVWIYTSVSPNPFFSPLLGFPLGFFPSGSFSPVGSFFAELFPSSFRASGQGFAYNFGRGIGALFPALVGALSAGHSLGHAIAIFSIGAYTLMFLSVLLLPETRGQTLG